MTRTCSRLKKPPEKDKVDKKRKQVPGSRWEKRAVILTSLLRRTYVRGGPKKDKRHCRKNTFTTSSKRRGEDPK